MSEATPHIQEQNKKWWSENPMLYDWEKTNQLPPFSKEYFEQADKRFFQAMDGITHDLSKSEIPFSRLIDFKRWKGKQVLEIGCGAGAIATVLSQQGLNLTAVDITEKAIDIMKKRMAVFGIKPNVLVADAEKLPFPDNSFDLVWSWGVIHHTSDTNAAAREIFRVLKPGGFAQVMVYHRASLRWWVEAGLIEGIIRGRLWKESLEEINKKMTDGFLARHYTANEFKKVFGQFPNPKTRVMSQSEWMIPSSKLNRLLKSVLGSRIHSSIDNFLRRRYGWFLYLEAEKPA